MTAASDMGQRIAELRHRRRMTQEQLGQQLNVSGQAVSKWENGDSMPDVSLLSELARVLECTTDFLLGADKNGGINRYMPALEAELRNLEPSDKVDMAFKLFHLIDETSQPYTKPSIEQLENDAADPGLPFVHAGPDGVTVWWRGKFVCSASMEALKKTDTVWTDSSLPVDLFPEAWNALFSALLTRKVYFNTDMAISEEDLMNGLSPETDFVALIGQMMDSGLLEKGKGGYKAGIKTEVLLRLLAVLLHTVCRPGVLSHSNRQRDEAETIK